MPGQLRGCQSRAWLFGCSDERHITRGSRLIRRAISLAPVGRLSDPHVLVDVAVAAEENGWDGLFLWDHVLRPAEEPAGLLDPWVTLTAIAAVTTRIRIGPMITPIARRRPLKLAREAATLDLFSRGRLTLGLGLGVDAGGELTRSGEELDPKTRGTMLDEGVALLDKLLRGERVVHRGTHYTVDGVTLTPAGVQRPRVPFWLAARGHALAPVRRAAKYEGVALLAVTPDRFAELVECVQGERGRLEGFDFAVWATPDYPLRDYEQRGATWVVYAVGAAVGRTESYWMQLDDSVEHLMAAISKEGG